MKLLYKKNNNRINKLIYKFFCRIKIKINFVILIELNIILYKYLINFEHRFTNLSRTKFTIIFIIFFRGYFFK